MHCSSKSLEQLTDTVNTELSRLSDWFKANRLSLNIAKTNFTIIGNNRHNIHIYSDGCEKQMSHVKFLEITVDEKLEYINQCKTN